MWGLSQDKWPNPLRQSEGTVVELQRSTRYHCQAVASIQPDYVVYFIRGYPTKQKALLFAWSEH